MIRHAGSQGNRNLPSYLCNTRTKERKGKDRELVFAISTSAVGAKNGITITRYPYIYLKYVAAEC